MITKKEVDRIEFIKNELIRKGNHSGKETIFVDVDKTIKKLKGGKRIGSGAKPKYNEPTKTIAFRVPVSRIEHVKSLLKTLLNGWAVK